MRYLVKWQEGKCSHEAHTDSEKTAMALYVLLSYKNLAVELWRGSVLIASFEPQAGVMPQQNDKGRD